MIPLLLFLLACAMIYVGTVQAAFSAMMRLSLRLMAERAGRSGALEQYLEDPARLFVPARLLLALIVILAGLLLAPRVSSLTGPTTPAVFIGLLAGVILCEHLVPSLIVRRNPQQVLELLLPSFRYVAMAVSPLGTLVRRVAAWRGRLQAPKTADEQQPPEEASADVSGAPPLAAEREEHALLRSLVDFGDRLVREVMTPRPDIVAIRADATLEELRAFFREQEYSRIPVYKDDLDNVLGFVFVKDLMKRTDDPGGTPVTSLMRAAYFVPETKRVPELLKEFQRNQVQSAIVVDEYGGTAGLVTLEDLIEELVGEIRDEYDVEAEPVVDEGNGSFLFSGKADVDEIARRLGVDIAREGFETVGGFLLSQLGRVPAVGETFDIDGLSVEVLEAERRRVHKVRVRKREAVVQEG